MNLYFLAKVRFNKPDWYITKKLEPFLHGVPIAYMLMFVIMRIIFKGWNEGGIGSCSSFEYDPLTVLATKMEKFVRDLRFHVDAVVHHQGLNASTISQGSYISFLLHSSCVSQSSVA